MPALAPEAQKALDRALFFGMHNNWTERHEREHARNVLDAVVRDGLLDVDTAVGYAPTHVGVSKVVAKNPQGPVKRTETSLLPTA